MTLASLAPTDDTYITAGLRDAVLPIFFFQSGSKTGFFFDKILSQAVLTNGLENVFVLTDSNFHLYQGYNCIDISEYSYGTAAFDKLYRHHSANKIQFEKACFDRWFIINAIVKKHNIDYFFHADSDVLIAEDLKPFYQSKLKDRYSGSMMFFENGAGRSITSGHSSFWSSKLINDFCNFVCGSYSNKQKFNVILKDAADGKFYDNTNVSDMILLDVFRTETKPATLNLFSLEAEDICFDFNVNVSYNGFNYHFLCNPIYKIKQLTQRNNGLYGRVKQKDGSFIYRKFYTLHFQGYLTKSLIPLYLTDSATVGALSNKALGLFHFTVRKLKLYKTKIKGKLRNYFGS